MVEALQMEAAGAPAHQRISDRVSGDLFRLIVTLQLRPGAILNENSLMQRLQCGRTPLREALLDLERQSLVRIVPRQATLVTEITLTDAAEIYEALECIEGPIARLAAGRIGPALLAELDGIASGLRSASDAAPPPPDALYRTCQLDFGFHETIARAARNRFLLSALQALRGTAMRLMCLGLGRPEGAASLPGEHGRILEALSARDPAAAERAVREHLAAGKRRTFERAASAPFGV